MEEKTMRDKGTSFGETCSAGVSIATRKGRLVLHKGSCLLLRGHRKDMTIRVKRKVTKELSTYCEMFVQIIANGLGSSYFIHCRARPSLLIRFCIFFFYLRSNIIHDSITCSRVVLPMINFQYAFDSDEYVQPKLLSLLLP